MSGEEDVEQRPVEAHEGAELGREDVVGAHVEPRLGRHDLVLGAGLRHRAEIALRQQADLVVVVEDHAPVTGHAEVLEQHVARKGVRRREVLDDAAEVEDRVPAGGLVGGAQVQVERGDPALGVHVLEHDAVAVELDAPAGRLQQLGEEPVRDAMARNHEMLELLRVHQAAGPIVLEDELVAPHHVLARGALRIPEAVADHLEDDVIGGQREHQHDEAGVAGGDLESIRASGPDAPRDRGTARPCRACRTPPRGTARRFAWPA